MTKYNKITKKMFYLHTIPTFCLDGKDLTPSKFCSCHRSVLIALIIIGNPIRGIPPPGVLRLPAASFSSNYLLLPTPPLPAKCNANITTQSKNGKPVGVK
jgi:hypothetical protein